MYAFAFLTVQCHENLHINRCVIIHSAAACQLRADMVFVLDASSSITWADTKNWNPRLLGFTKSIVNAFPIGSNETRVGVVRFSDSASVQIYLDEYYDAANLEVRGVSSETSTLCP